VISDWLQRLVYEAPATVALGPACSALVAGYAVVACGRVVITSAGERYLRNVNSEASGHVSIAADSQITEPCVTRSLQLSTR
jgi:hypothetical protein